MMENGIDKDILSPSLRGTRDRNLRPFMVEILGPAGAGKTTLASALCQRNRNIVVAKIPGARTFRNAPFFISNGLALLPIFFRQPANSRKLTWREIKMMIHVNGWYELLNRRVPSGNRVILLDHGPVYRVVGLSEFGPRVTRSKDFEHWRDRSLTLWASYLDLVILLDAPNQILANRINNRETHHVVKGKSDQEISEFLTRFRLTYQETISYLEGLDGAPRVLKFDTCNESRGQIVSSVIRAIDQCYKSMN